MLEATALQQVEEKEEGKDVRPRSSMGSPMTFMIRPRHPGPTGMMMGAPVSTTLVPRTCRRKKEGRRMRDTFVRDEEGKGKAGRAKGAKDVRDPQFRP